MFFQSLIVKFNFLFNYKYILLFFCLSVSIDNYADDLNPLITDQLDCSTSLKQIMKPVYPYTTLQGYSIVSFTINKDGSVGNIKAAESNCAVSRSDDGSINFKPCPFFKKVSVDAAKYLKFLPPKNLNNNSCSIEKHTRKYTYRFYESLLEDKNQFLLRDEVNLILDKDFKNINERNEFVKKVLTKQL